ncbi:MAG: hypothetical protein ABIN01_00015 [Ferruginibacter sp.]
MKIRIKGNSLRIRVSKSEVEKLASIGYLEEQTCFVDNALIYALQVKPNGDELSADFINGKITMYVPDALVKDWPVNDITGFNAKMPTSTPGSLILLLEKDFICLDTTAEDQSDNYQNPKSC